MRQRPLGIGLDWHSVPERVFAPHVRFDDCMGLFLGFHPPPVHLKLSNFGDWVVSIIGTEALNGTER